MTISSQISSFSVQRNVSEKTYFQQTCTAEEGELPFTFEWFKNSQPIRSETGIKVENSSRFSILIIESIKQKDSAHFKCLVRNKHGFDSQEIHLIVKGMNCLLLGNAMNIQRL